MPTAGLAEEGPRHIHACSCTHTVTHAHTDTQTCTHTQSHTHTQIHTQTCTHTQSHTHRYTHRDTRFEAGWGADKWVQAGRRTWVAMGGANPGCTCQPCWALGPERLCLWCPGQVTLYLQASVWPS